MTDYLSLSDYHKCPRCEKWHPVEKFQRVTNGFTRLLKSCEVCREKKKVAKGRETNAVARKKEEVFIHARPDNPESIRINRLWPAPECRQTAE